MTTDQAPILHLICGLPGSGKTTLSKQIALREKAIRFCPDEWIKDIWPEETAETEGNDFRDQIEQLQWKMAKEVLRSGVDVIIEWGTWGKDERLTLRDEAWAIGAKVKFYHLEATPEVLRERIVRRNQNLGQYEFHMPEETLNQELARCFQQFQVPDEEELNSYDFLG